MAEDEEKPIVGINGFTTIHYLKENLTTIDLSHKNLYEIDENIKFPKQLCEINLSNNKLKYVPQSVMDLYKLRRLNISFNTIDYFDDTPNFCHEIEDLDICNNNLLGPPYWIWSESPKKLSKINLSNNINITSALHDEYFKELLQYTTLVKDVTIFNCRLRKHKEILSTFSNAKSITLGADNLSYISGNVYEDVPSLGLKKCCVLEKLNVRSTFVCNISADISLLCKNLKEIDLSQNKISGLPKEFCQLTNLEVCLLSFNSILYLPNEFVNLKKLQVLCIDSNELCMLPENMNQLENLKKLDLYDNYLNEVPDIECLDEVDLAQNYFDEPENEIYLEKRYKIRLHNVDRWSGRKPEPIDEQSDESQDELRFLVDGDDADAPEHQDRPVSDLSEDWDSEEWWSPHYSPRISTPVVSEWHMYVKRKMDEGSFCPSDLHIVSIAEQVKYEKICNPKITREVIGQFDDLSDDDS